MTTYYYLGGKLIANRVGTTLTYIHQDSLGSSSVMSDSNGASLSSISYYPFGLTRSGSVSTDKKFTGQRLDDTGLYYYGARYYDATIGRFISPDTIVPNPSNPQTLNRYSYCQNNPLKYTDPTGHWPKWLKDLGNSFVEFGKGLVDSYVNLNNAFNQVLFHPIESAQAFSNALIHLGETTKAIVSNYQNLMSTTRGTGEICGEILITVAIIEIGSAIKGSLAAANTPALPKVSSGPPPNGGALGNWSKKTFSEGGTFSRYGSTSGKYASPVGTSFEARSLPLSTQGKPLTTYTVVKSFVGQQSIVAPWYNQPGLGIQYLTFPPKTDPSRTREILVN